MNMLYFTLITFGLRLLLVFQCSFFYNNVVFIMFIE